MSKKINTRELNDFCYKIALSRTTIRGLSGQNKDDKMTRLRGTSGLAPKVSVLPVH